MSNYEDCLGPLRHAWDFVQFLPPNRRFVGGRPCLYRCMRCDSEKIETYDSRGQLMTRRYEHSKPYEQLLQGGRLTIEEYRVKLMAKQRKIAKQQKEGGSNVRYIRRTS